MEYVKKPETLFERYCMIKAYSRFMESELKRVRIEKGQLLSEVDRFVDLSEDIQKELIKDEMYEALKGKLKEEKETS